MKKYERIIAITIVALVLLTALSTHAQAIATYSIRIESNPLVKNGNRITEVELMRGGTYTLYADDKDNDFLFWKITGKYQTVSSDYEEKSMTIKPESDIVAVANYGDVSKVKGHEQDEQPLGGLEVIAVLMLITLLYVVIFFTKRRIKK